MFKEFVETKHYSFHEGFADWRDAVRAACAPLLADGTIEKEYPEIIIEKVEELGPYIVIAPDICIPHAERGRGVNGTAMCFMKTEKPVSFDPDDPEKDARIFVVLAATDDEVHLPLITSRRATSVAGMATSTGMQSGHSSASSWRICSTSV